MKAGSTTRSLLDKLIFAGKNEEDFEIGGVTFTLSSLSEDQNKSMVSYLFSLDETERISLTKSVAVASSLVRVDGIDIELISEEYGDGDTDLIKKISIVSKMQSSVVNTLFEKFGEVNKTLNIDNEVVEDIKNS